MSFNGRFDLVADFQNSSSFLAPVVLRANDRYRRAIAQDQQLALVIAIDIKHFASPLFALSKREICFGRRNGRDELSTLNGEAGCKFATAASLLHHVPDLERADVGTDQSTEFRHMSVSIRANAQNPPL
ncbi:hypothetical protein [Bradyrhizobium manausense]|uniref:hypothetical protein n=1 Tax=Bradyrhizobium manausense TaxID=989370 RepID=UPI0012ED0456|nr:hypothetical protein [Bradyrhizobium manausense]